MSQETRVQNSHSSFETPLIFAKTLPTGKTPPIFACFVARTDGAQIGRTYGYETERPKWVPTLHSAQGSEAALVCALLDARSREGRRGGNDAAGGWHSTASLARTEARWTQRSVAEPCCGAKVIVPSARTAEAGSKKLALPKFVAVAAKQMPSVVRVLLLGLVLVAPVLDGYELQCQPEGACSFALPSETARSSFTRSFSDQGTPKRAVHRRRGDEHRGFRRGRLQSEPHTRPSTRALLPRALIMPRAVL